MVRAISPEIKDYFDTRFLNFFINGSNIIHSYTADSAAPITSNGFLETSHVVATGQAMVGLLLRVVFDRQLCNLPLLFEVKSNQRR